LSDSDEPAPPRQGGSRLGIYFDEPYWIVARGDARELSTSHPLALFLVEVGRQFGQVTLFGHAKATETAGPYAVPADVELVELGYFSSLRRPIEVVRALPRSVSGFWRGLRSVDAVWLFGPHPYAIVGIALAAVRRKRILLGVRQDTVRVMQARLPGRRGVPLIAMFRGMDGVYRLISRRSATAVQGRELAARYGGRTGRVLVMTESVLRSRDVVEQPAQRDWSGEIMLLTVARIEPEKNPRLLVEALARLDAENPGRYRVVWVGEGSMEDAVRAHAAELGIDHILELRGYVPIDAGLLDLYRGAHLFVHVSFSEGMPKVLIEAFASGVPVVATDVGGVRAVADDGRAALLVPPDDLTALVEAIRRLENDADLRERLAARGLELARGLTLEAEAERVGRFLRGAGV
jgi:glycosyltransferase involved in cell wall biosynthesis